jgi:hypothetical protein
MDQQTRLIRVAVAYGLTHPGGAIERILRGCGILDDPVILSGVGEISTYDFSDYDRSPSTIPAITTSMNTLQKKMSILRMVTSTRRIIDEASGAALRRDSFIHFWKGGKPSGKGHRPRNKKARAGDRRERGNSCRIGPRRLARRNRKDDSFPKKALKYMQRARELLAADKRR